MAYAKVERVWKNTAVTYKYFMIWREWGKPWETSIRI